MAWEHVGDAVSASSLMGGWLPVAVQILTALALIRAIGGRTRRWWLVVAPLLLALAVTAAVGAQWAFTTLGMASEPAPFALWAWAGSCMLALGIVVATWRGHGWARRNLSVFTASMCLLSTGLAVNTWIGYVPTVGTAWNQATAGPLPDETDWAALSQLPRGQAPSSHGALVRVKTSSAASGFEHRDELVYLPPAWFTSDVPPRLPTVMMIGGQFNTPADWVRAGEAVHTLDAFAAANGGSAPVAVFVDPSGSFTNDTECVNGPRGNAADHLVKDVVPYVVSTFGVSDAPANWGVVGFSTGGTCALDLAVMHPDVFSVFVDIAGDPGPNSGNHVQTIDRLFGGDAQAWSAYDPATAITRHGRYRDTAGVFVVPESESPAAADELCALGTTHGIDCSVSRLPGRHVWPFGATAFAATLPWLAGTLGAPGISGATPPPGV